MQQHVAVQQNDSAEERNETTPHRNPDEYSEDGDLEGVERWLSNRLTSQLGESAIQLSEGEYELASDYVGEEYRNRLEQYVDVAGQTSGESNEETFEETGEQQARLTEAVQEYRDTKAEYEAARQAGNEERARELARELESLADEIESLGGSVREGYIDIEAETGTDLSESDAAIENVTDEIESEQAVVRAQEFTETDLSLTIEREEISFRDPLVATGELRTLDGSPIANEEIRLDIGNHTERVTTDASGGFTLEYRPTDESLSTDELDIQYVPDTQSIYLGDETTVDVSIDQVEPTLVLEETPSEVAYGERHAVTGELTVDGRSVDGVPVSVSLGGERLETVPVKNGVFGSSSPIPAAVEDGDRDLVVRLPLEGQALAGTANTTTVTVRETQSTLSIDETSISGQEVMVNGSLATVDGDGVRGESVQIRIDGSTVDTVTTEAGGSFGTTVSIPSSSSGDMTVAAVYTGDGSNLETARVETTVMIDGSASRIPTPVLLAGGFVAVIAAGLGLWWVRRSDEGASPASPARDQGGVAGERTPADRSTESTADPVDPLLERAADQLAAGRPNDAVRTSYAAVRRALASRIDGQKSLTHWEFYRTYRNADAAETDLLRAVTQGYERAAFDPGTVPTTESAALLEKARRLCDLSDSSDEGVPADDKDTSAYPRL
ncbi:hypothetical protein C488_08097 [Natrinema pellirubrum DSM 15624]|nr:hypothetical protein [Natrinema pellirubrum]ELY76572.1 hypothetical protein C488_08097 [Natrinema pellirubrum DSM 15624]